MSGGKSTGVQPGFRMTDPSRADLSDRGGSAVESRAGERGGDHRHRVLSRDRVSARSRSISPRSIATTLVIADSATMRDPLNGKRRRVRKPIWTLVFERAARQPNGRYRVLVSRFARRRPIGNFRYYGTRPDDPNDIVAHEHRRELRGARVFGAWLNHDDSRGINSLDMLETADGRSLGQALHVRLRLHPRQRHGVRAAASARQRIHLRAAPWLADAGDARLLRPAVDAHRLSRHAAVDRPIRGGGVRSR